MCLLPNILAGTGRRCQILEEVFENTKILLGRGDTHVESNSLLSGEGLTSLWTQQKNRREWESPPPPPPDTFAETGSRQEPVSQAAPAKLCPYWAERFLPDPSSAWRAGHPAPPPPPASIPKSARGQKARGPGPGPPRPETLVKRKKRRPDIWNSLLKHCRRHSACLVFI